MITRTPGSRQDWRQSIRKSIRQIEPLIDALDASSSSVSASQQAHEQFSTLVPMHWLDRVDRSDPDDPLLRQVLPVADETRVVPGYSTDPVGDASARRNGGIVHKYHGRALLIATGACAINCRYCFRRHYPYSKHNASRDQWSAAMAYLTANKDISELILSGGDPLMLSTERLAPLLEQLATLKHIRSLRIHTRIPVALPDRVDDALTELLSQWQQRLVIVIHSNHANELDQQVADSLDRLRRAGGRLFNQAVLLKGVNDQWPLLAALSHRLFDLGVQPYYLNLLDRAAGTAHFDVDQETAVQIMRQLMTHLPGYLVPKLVREQAGERYKLPVL